MQERIDAGDFPSAVYLVAEKGEIVLHDALGWAVVEPQKIEAKLDTIYDLASLTKPLVTGLLAAKLIENGDLDPNEPLGSLLSEFYTSEYSDVTVNDLAMHTSGMPAWKPLYLLAREPENVLDEISVSLSAADQDAVTYSDLNFIVLAAIVERKTGRSLEKLAARDIFEPLELRSTMFNPSPEIKSRIAASEKGAGYEREMCIEQDFGNSHPALREHQLWGEVHDSNAYFMGGVAGHAGLFSTAEEVLKIGRQFLPDQTQLLMPETCALFQTDFTPRMNEARSFGFQLASTKDSTAGTKMSPQSFGHNGFTGTSLWIDPVKERVFILLTNRTHHRELPFANINGVRRAFSDMAVDMINKDS